MFVIAVIIHGRQIEWTARLDFLWQIQVLFHSLSLFPDLNLKAAELMIVTNFIALFSGK